MPARSTVRRWVPAWTTGWLGLAAAGAAGSWLAGGMVLGGTLAWVAAPWGALILPWIWTRRRQEQAREDVATAMERLASGMASALAAGMVPYEALLEVTRTTEGLLGSQLRRVLRDAERVGLSEALWMLGARLPLPEVRLLVSGLRLNQGTGAELATSLEALGRTLRERREVRAGMRAATAAGRWQANILVLVPPVLLGFMHRVYPAFEQPLLSTGHGRLLLALAAGWVVLGYLVVLRMCLPREVL